MVSWQKDVDLPGLHITMLPAILSTPSGAVSPRTKLGGCLTTSDVLGPLLVLSSPLSIFPVSK